MQQTPESGFSLIEALVALSVLAVSSTVILSSTENHTQRVSALKDRAHARWVALNRFERLAAGETNLSDRVSMGGQEWNLNQVVGQTGDPDLMRVDVSVGPATGGTKIAFITGFVMRDALR